MHDDISDTAVEMRFMNCEVSKIYKGTQTHSFYYYFFMSLSLCECKGYGFVEAEGQGWKEIRHNLVQSLHF